MSRSPGGRDVPGDVMKNYEIDSIFYIESEYITFIPRIYINCVTLNHYVDYVFICDSVMRYTRTYLVLKTDVICCFNL